MGFMGQLGGWAVENLSRCLTIKIKNIFTLLEILKMKFLKNLEFKKNELFFENKKLFF